jgi:hypothetical protein
MDLVAKDIHSTESETQPELKCKGTPPKEEANELNRRGSNMTSTIFGEHEDTAVVNCSTKQIGAPTTSEVQSN